LYELAVLGIRHRVTQDVEIRNPQPVLRPFVALGLAISASAADDKLAGRDEDKL
jgi:hypothetical protein